MKKIMFVCLSAALLAACNNSNENAVENKLDSLEERKDTLINKVDSTVEARVDSLKEKGKELKEKFDSSIEAKKDSLKKKD